MTSLPRTACKLALAAAFAGVPLAVLAQPVPGPGPAVTGPVGCYQVTEGLPAGYTMAFCLDIDHDGSFRLGGPGFSCEERLDYQDRRDGIIHIELVLSVCSGADNVFTDDLNCMLVGPGIACTFDRERGLSPGQILAVRVY